MRKRTINHVADTIFWNVLAFLPIIMYLIYLFALQGSITQDFQWDGITTFLNKAHTGFDGLSIVYEVLYNLFSDEGLLPVFGGAPWIFGFMEWFVGIHLLHVCVDFILFIPKVAQKWMNSLTRSE